MKHCKLLSILALTFVLTLTSKNCSGQIESQLRVGKAINVFIRYGYLSISMKVISYNDTERWLFKEPTKNVFQVSSMQTSYHRKIMSNNKKKHKRDEKQQRKINRKKITKQSK